MPETAPPVLTLDDTSAVARILVVTAHPDDVDFGAAGSVATWTKAGVEVAYCIATNGEAGGADLSVTREDMVRIRQEEQRAAAQCVGVTDVTFLGHPDGRLMPTIELRRDISRQVRIHRPERLVCQSPDRMWDRIGASHVRVFGGPIPKGATEQQAIAWAVEVLKRGAEYAGSRGIILGVEDDGGLTIAAEPTIEIVKQAASPWVGINADSGNFRANGYSQFALVLPYATSFHLKRDITTADGKTEKADWNRLLTMIGKSNYKGYVGFEYEADNADADVPRLAAELRTLVRKLSA